MRIQAFQKLPCVALAIFRIGALDTEEKTVLTGSGETRYVENRMIGHGQIVANHRAEDRSESGEQNGHFKGDWDEAWTTVEGAAANIQRVVDYMYPILQTVASNRAQ